MSEFDELQKDIEQLKIFAQDPKWGAAKLRAITLFANITDSELETLYALGDLVDHKSKSNLVIEGEPTRGLYVLLYGKVSVYKNDHSDKSMTRLAVLDPGSVFGELSLFDDARRSATVVSETDCLLFSLSIDDFEDFLASSDEIKWRFYKKCAEEMATRFRVQNKDFIQAQKLLWKHALQKETGSPPTS